MRKHRTGCEHRSLAGSLATLDEIAELVDILNHLCMKAFENGNRLMATRL